MAKNGEGVVSVGQLQCNDIAGRCAVALSISKAEFLQLQKEDPIYTVKLGHDQHDDVYDEDERFNEKYSFKELVRRNFSKDYGSLIQSELEKYLRATDFVIAFTKTKEEFYLQPRWKQMAQKKTAMLF